MFGSRKILVFCLAALPLAGCNSPAPMNVEDLQSLAEAACTCNRTAKDRSAYNDAAPTSCWAKFDSALKRTKWEYMSVAADGPTSSAAICIGGGSDGCANEKMVWIEHGLGACSAAEAKDRFSRFDACLKSNGGDEIKCANALQ